ncbi:MAG: glycoside hydrolase family 76 protein [Solirubrobacteraceae bacterium]
MRFLRSRRPARSCRRRSGLAALAALAIGLVAPATAGASTNPAAPGGSVTASSSSYQPLTPWTKPPLRLPKPKRLDYRARAEAGLKKASYWKAGGWYCEYLGCPGRYPLATIWGAVGMFESADGLQLADPTGSHRVRVEHFARAAERYWDAAVGGFAPYPGDRSAKTEVWFDDNGWIGLAFYNAYVALHRRRYLADAQRAFRFIASKGWDAAAGGGMWWNTDHPYHSGPALAADTLLGTLLYNADHERWQLEDVTSYVQWGNANDTRDERQLYLEQPNQPSSVIGYVQAPLIYAQYLLCKDGLGEAYCVHAGRLAATLAEQNVSREGYRYNYGPQYDAIFMQWMMAYGQATGEGYWRKLAEVNAAGAAQHAYAKHGLALNTWWGGPFKNPETRPHMLRTDAATTSLYSWLAYYTKVTSR